MHPVMPAARSARPNSMPPSSSGAAIQRLTIPLASPEGRLVNLFGDYRRLGIAQFHIGMGLGQRAFHEITQVVRKIVPLVDFCLDFAQLSDLFGINGAGGGGQGSNTVLQMHLHCLDMLLQIHTHKAAATTAVAMHINEAGGEVVSATVDDLVRSGSFSVAVAGDFAVFFQQPAVGQQPVSQNQGSIGEKFSHLDVLLYDFCPEGYESRIPFAGIECKVMSGVKTVGSAVDGLHAQELLPGLGPEDMGVESCVKFHSQLSSFGLVVKHLGAVYAHKSRAGFRCALRNVDADTTVTKGFSAYGKIKESISGCFHADIFWFLCQKVGVKAVVIGHGCVAKVFVGLIDGQLTLRNGKIQGDPEPERGIGRGSIHPLPA